MTLFQDALKPIDWLHVVHVSVYYITFPKTLEGIITKNIFACNMTTTQDRVVGYNDSLTRKHTSEILCVPNTEVVRLNCYNIKYVQSTNLLNKVSTVIISFDKYQYSSNMAFNTDLYFRLHFLKPDRLHVSVHNRKISNVPCL